MASDPPPEPRGDASDVDQATTQAGAEWPVAEQYRVVPEPGLADELEDERGAITVAPAPRRWIGVPATIVVGLLALLLLAGAAAAWLVTRSDPSSASPPPARPHTTPTTPPQGQGGPPPASSTSTAQATDTSASSTTTTSTTPTRRIATPDVVGLRASAAVKRLRSVRLEPAIRVVRSSDGDGTVLAQRPRAGTEVDAGARVQLRVAKNARSGPGPGVAAPAKVSVPGLVQSDAAEAKSRLRALGLHWSVTTRASDSPRGTVLAQAPPPGTQVAKGTTVRLTVSSGEAQVSVPDVTGLDAASARAQLEGAGFEVSIVDQPTSDQSQDGMVVAQEPAGGSSAAKGSTVTITIARFG